MRVWNKFPPEIQKKIQEAAKEAARWEKAMVRRGLNNGKAMKVLEGYGTDLKFTDYTAYLRSKGMEVVVLGAGLGFEQLIHPRFESIFSRFPKAGRAALIVFSYLLTAALFAALLWATWRAIYVDMTLFHSTSAALGLPSWYYDAPVFVCVALALRRLWRGFQIEMRRNREGAEQ